MSLSFVRLFGRLTSRRQSIVDDILPVDLWPDDLVDAINNRHVGLTAELSDEWVEAIRTAKWGQPPS